MSDVEEPADVPFEVVSIYGARTRRGLVQLRVGHEQHLLLPSKAREIATFLLEGASAAEGDEVLMRVFARTGVSDTRAAQMMVALRQERAIIERRARAEARRAVAQDQYDPDEPEQGGER